VAIYNQRGGQGIVAKIIVKALKRKYPAVIKRKDEVLAFFAHVGVTPLESEFQSGIRADGNNTVLPGSGTNQLGILSHDTLLDM